MCVLLASRLFGAKILINVSVISRGDDKAFNHCLLILHGFFAAILAREGLIGKSSNGGLKAEAKRQAL